MSDNDSARSNQILIFRRKWKIIAGLNIKASRIANHDNYYEKYSAYIGDGITFKFEYYKKGNDYYRIWYMHPSDETYLKIINYKKGKEYIEIVESKDGKHLNKISDNEDNIINPIKDILFSTGDLLYNIKLAALSRIETRECNGKICYLIKDGSLQRYFDEETGIVVRVINDDLSNTSGKTSTVADIEFEFNSVTYEDIKRPDITEIKND